MENKAEQELQKIKRDGTTSLMTFMFVASGMALFFVDWAILWFGVGIPILWFISDGFRKLSKEADYNE